MAARPTTAADSKPETEMASEKASLQNEKQNAGGAAADGANEKTEYPPLRIVVAVMAALYIAMFLVSLDRIIISTAIPRITDEFHSIDDIGWYGSAYVLATCATQLLFGRLFAFYNNKAVFLAAVVLFEAGSALCGAAPNSVAFILGRVLAGAGAAGVFAGVIVIMIPLVPLHKRPMYQGFLGAIFGVSSVVGPLVGGAFTTNPRLTWRWCFYINLPIGAVCVVIVLLFLRMPAPPGHALAAREKAQRMDPLGTLLFTPAIVCLLLALEWGGTAYAWRSGRVVALLVLFAVLFVAWVVAEARMGELATVPRRLFCQRSIVAGMAFSLCVGGVMLGFSYYMAVWFQAVDGVDALQSGIRTLPFVLAIVVASIVAGGGVSRCGYYAPFVLASACLMAVGMGLLTTLRVTSGHSAWIGYQFVLGFGMGLGMQMSGLAAQVVLAPADVPVGASLMFFGQGLGGAVFMCVAQNVFLQALLRDLSRVMPAAAAQLLTKVGATNIRSAVSTELLPAVLVAYNKALVSTFYVPLAIACVSIVPALCFEWRSVKTAREAKDVESKGAQREK
ncbi:Major facilitator superfamily domain, general substrate transporter [Niveomyces insectorum RCEF 264]|uniref:Major facilitator superfamily domain, general substrate transporter n=1 Tax=Niveomyces insectorum RCEF 264 TaxID=1081102 RepID=A0A168A730_9HYPO|nr:Major facilitator superfamily domain, general substrate transporter [Niveomyces insectorum RCEF 264]